MYVYLHLLIRSLLLLYAYKFLLRMYISRFRILPTGYSNVIYVRLFNYVLCTVIYDYSKHLLHLHIIIIIIWFVSI